MGNLNWKENWSGIVKSVKSLKKKKKVELGLLNENWGPTYNTAFVVFSPAVFKITIYTRSCEGHSME